MTKTIITITIFSIIFASAFFLGIMTDMIPFIKDINHNTFAFLDPKALFLIGMLVFVLLVGLVSTFT